MTRAASRRDHQQFCKIEGWDEVKNSRGKSTRHHITYELPLADRRILRTRISRPANKEAYGVKMWTHILTDQFDVTDEEFWECVKNRNLPVRVQPTASTPRNSLPLSLARQLVDELGLTSQEVEALSLDDAIARMQEHWSQPTD